MKTRIFCIILVLLVLSGCQSMQRVSVSHPPKALSAAEERLLEWLREDSSAQESISQKALQWDARLHLTARALAMTKASGREGSAQNALPIFLEQAGVYERPVFAAWATGRDGPNCAHNLAKRSIPLLHGGFSLLGLGRADGPDGPTCALVVSKQDLILDETPPRRLPDQGEYHLSGTLGDDIGRLWLLIQTPSHQARRESLPVVDGRFETTLTFRLPGRYNLELLRQDAFGTQWHRVALFPVFHQEPAVPPRARLEFQLDVTEFPRAAGETARLLRERRRQSPLPTSAEMKRDLLALAQKSRHELLPSDGTIRSLWVAPQSNTPCSWQRSWTNDLGAYLDASVRSPAQYYWLGRSTNQFYTALAVKENHGYRLHELLCSSETDKEHWIGPAYSHDQQIRYITLIRRAVEGRLGYGFAETDETMLQRHILNEALLILERRGLAASFINPRFAKALGEKDPEGREALDWAFTYFWSAYQDALARKDAQAGSLKLMVILAMLHQKRFQDARTLSTTPVPGETENLAHARHRLVEGWLAGVQGDVAHARSAFKQAASLYSEAQRPLQARRIREWAAILSMQDENH